MTLISAAALIPIIFFFFYIRWLLFQLEINCGLLPPRMEDESKLKELNRWRSCRSLGAASRTTGWETLSSVEKVSNFTEPKGHNCVHVSSGRPASKSTNFYHITCHVSWNCTVDCTISLRYVDFFLSRHKTKSRRFLVKIINFQENIIHFHITMRAAKESINGCQLKARYGCHYGTW